ncbi:MAG: hypothetical protein WCP57_03965 [Bacteroidota bacterium]
MRKYYTIILLSLGLFFLSNCLQTNNNNNSKNISFYIWNNQINISHDQKNYLDSLKTRCIYIKLVEFKKDEIIRSKVINVYDSCFSIIPVVRLDNYFLANTNYTNAEKCEQLFQEVQQQINSFSKKKIITIQLDCDYQSSNLQAYQNIVSSLKNNYHLKVQITLNVYRTADVLNIPKADEYFIMLYDFYNASKIDIHNFEFLEKFKNHLHSFPNKHQYVIPIFSRWVVYENGKAQLEYQFKEDQIKNNSDIVYTGNGSYLVTKQLLIDNQLIKKGAIIVYQETTLDDLKKYTLFIKELSPQQSNQLVLFSFNNKIPVKFSVNTLLELK